MAGRKKLNKSKLEARVNPDTPAKIKAIALDMGIVLDWQP
jgi:hypothetical protein